MDRPTATLARFAAGWETHSPAETEAAGAALAEVLPLNTALALHGDLGAGKTTLVRGLARGVGHPRPGGQPTFNYFLVYRGTRQLAHLDAYRLNRPEDADGLLLDEFCSALVPGRGVAGKKWATACHPMRGTSTSPRPTKPGGC